MTMLQYLKKPGFPFLKTSRCFENLLFRIICGQIIRVPTALGQGHNCACCNERASPARAEKRLFSAPLSKVHSSLTATQATFFLSHYGT